MAISNANLKEGTNMGYKEEEVKEMWKVFGMFDQDANGSIQKNDVMPFLQCFGQNPTVEDCDKIMEKMGKKGNQKITFLELIQHIKEDIKDSETLKEELKKSFLTFDPKETGYLTQSELKDILTNFGDRLNDEEVNEMLMLVDADKEDRVNYEDFINQFVVEKSK